MKQVMNCHKDNGLLNMIRRTDPMINNICSDIIESTFGYFKERISPNKNNGYTPLVLLIPLRLQLSTIEDCKSFNARTAIGKTKMEDI